LRYLFAGILYVALYLGAGALLDGYPLLRMTVVNTLLLLLAAAVPVVVLRRRREWEGTQRLFWDTFAAGLALWCVGQIGFTWATWTGHRSWVQWHTMFSLCGGIGPTVALVARPYLGPRKPWVWVAAANVISYAMLAGFVFAYFVMVPSVVPTSGPSPQATLLTLVQLQRFVLAAGLGWSVWLARGSSWRPTFVRLAIGATIGFILRFFTSGAISRAQYQEGGLYDLAWIVPFGCYLWAALEAPRSEADSAPVPARRGWTSGVVSALPVFMIPLVGFGILQVQSIGEPGDSVRLLLTTLATVSGLGVLTLRVSLQSGELQRADARVRMMAAATEQTADLILITRADGRFEHANQACLNALGYSRDELSSMGLGSLLDPTSAAMIARIGAEVRERGIWRGTLLHRRKDGSTFPASSTVVALKTPEGAITHFVGVQRDVTEDMRLRDHLVHSERLSAVGELVAGVAHEINNPLQSIIGCVELMLEEGHGHVGDLELVKQEATRAGQIVRNLLAFVRRSSRDRSAADLNDIARAVAQLRARQLADRNIHLRMELAAAAVPVMVNREEIQQLVLNLVLNAEHALRSAPGGTISIRTAVREGASTLEVADDGPGVDAAVRGRVFEPFFTTKEVGQGTGLGLSIALGIATAHGGMLELRDSPRGACFRLTLPAGAPAAVSA